MEDDGALPAPLYDAKDRSREAERFSKDDDEEKEGEENQEIRA